MLRRSSSGSSMPTTL
uniref:Uncharacterized protein n=1 Tax=Arundo donax TaxID=35708 RepID=A0A0A9EEV0_ARUDO